MSSARSRTRGDVIVLIVLSAGLVGGVAAMAAGWSPAILAASAIAALTFAYAQRVSWALAFAGALLSLLGLHTLTSRLAPMLGVDFGLATAAVVALAGAGAVASLVVAVSRDALRAPARASLPTLFAALGLPAITLGYWLVALRWGPGMRVGWILDNDAVWNTMAAQFIVVDGGIDPVAHPNPAPSTAALAAVWMLPGRAAAEQVLRHDVTREAQLLLLVTLAAAALAGLVAARAVPARHALMRVIAGTAASGLVLGWYVLGFTAELGFLNAPVAVLVLLTAWVCWADVASAPVLAGAGLLVAATLLLATWAPLVVVPLALGVAGLFVAGRSLLARRGPAWALLGVAGASFVLYVVFVTLADLRSTGGALAADGAAPPVEPRDVAGVMGIVLATTLLVLLRRQGAGARHQAIGALVVLAAAAFGGGYLVLQRLNQGLGWWGYYPAKFAWLICVLLLVVAGGMLLAMAARAGTIRRTALIATASLAVLAVVAAGSLPVGGVRRLPAAVAIATDDRFEASGVIAERLFVLADAEPTIAARISADRAEDALLNSWLLQAHSEHSDDPIRAFSYGLDTDDAAAVCEAITTWGGGVRVVTNDPALTDELGAVCPDAGYEVVVSS